MSFLWVVTTASCVLALLAWRKARAAARRAEQLSQMYWELKYQHGELRVQVQRLASADADDTGMPATPDGAARNATHPADGFIPLSSLKR